MRNGNRFLGRCWGRGAVKEIACTREYPFLLRVNFAIIFSEWDGFLLSLLWKKEGLSLFLKIIAGDNRKIIGVCYDIWNVFQANTIGNQVQFNYFENYAAEVSSNNTTEIVYCGNKHNNYKLNVINKNVDNTMLF